MSSSDKTLRSSDEAIRSTGTGKVAIPTSEKLTAPNPLYSDPIVISGSTDPAINNPTYHCENDTSFQHEYDFISYSAKYEHKAT